MLRIDSKPGNRALEKNKVDKGDERMPAWIRLLLLLNIIITREDLNF